MEKLLYAHAAAAMDDMPAPANARELNRAAEELRRNLDSELFRALAEPARQHIISILILNDRLNIEQITRHLPQDRSVVSRHLKALRESGVVKATRDGRNTYYELDGGSVIKRLETLLKHLHKVMLSRTMA